MTSTRYSRVNPYLIILTAVSVLMIAILTKDAHMFLDSLFALVWSTPIMWIALSSEI